MDILKKTILIFRIKYKSTMLKYLLFIMITLLSQCAKVNSPKISAGVLDLSKWDFTQNTLLSLDGDWEFYWEEFIESGEPEEELKKKRTAYLKPGNRWLDQYIQGKNLSGTGYASYRIKFIFPEYMLGKMMGIRFKTTGGSAYKIFINKEVIEELGKVGKSKQSMNPTRRTANVYFKVEHTETILLIHISNFYHADGAFWYSPELGTASKLHFFSKRKQALDSFLLGSIIIMGLYHLSLYWYRKKDKVALIFGLFCITISIYNISVNEVFIYYLLPELPHKLTYILLSIYCIMIPLYLTFLNNLFINTFSNRVIQITWGIFILSYTFILFSPTEIGSSIERKLRYLVVFSALYAFWGIFKISIKRNTSKLLLVPNFLIIGSIVNDVLSIYEIIHTPLIFSYAIFLFIIAQSILLSRHFSMAFHNVELLSDKLQKINEELEYLVEKRTLQYKQEKQKAEDENAWKDRFIALVSHDLRSPLTVILNIHEFLLNTETGVSKEIKDSLITAKRIIINSLSMIKHLLNLSRFQTDYHKIEYKDIELNEVCERVIEHFSFESLKKNLSIQADIEENILLTVDEAIFMEILRNLIMNAIKYSHKNGEIWLEYAEDEIYQKVIVKDSGLGIHPKVLNSLFTKQVLVKEGTKGEKGFGVGLNLCQELIALHAGKIEVESIEGLGSSFTINIPSNRNTVLIIGVSIQEKMLRSLREDKLLPIYVNNIEASYKTLEEIEFKVILIYLDYPENILKPLLQKLTSDFLYSAKPVLFIGSSEQIIKNQEFLSQYFPSKEKVYYLERKESEKKLGEYTRTILKTD